MAAEEPLKRLGGGRWETKDGRFAIEPQSGTWVVVDNTQTDDLGLPLVRGPFGSLTAAREAIETARGSGPTESPLAERLKEARSRPASKTSGAGRSRDRGSTRKATGKHDEAEAHAAKGADEPAEPPEPRWLLDLSPADRRRARELVERLRDLGIEEPEPLARAEIVRDEPAITRLALERVIGAAIASARSPRGAGRAVAKAIMQGKDPELGARWKLVDDRGRRIDDLEVAD